MKLDQISIGYDHNMALELTLPKSNARISLADALRLRQNLENLLAFSNQIQTMGAAVLRSFQLASDRESGSLEGVVPSTDAFPSWASKCVLSRGRRPKGTLVTSVHLSHHEILEGKTSPAYELMAAARSHCIACIRRYLLMGHPVNLCSNSGWNAYDNAHYRDSHRRQATLQYLDAAGLRASLQYRSFITQRNLSFRRTTELSSVPMPFKIPRLADYPAWASVCGMAGTRSVDVEPGQLHLTEEQSRCGESLPEYFIIAAARASCLYCMRLCLVSGYMIGTTSRSGWNVWDNVHATGGHRVADVLCFVEEAGGHMSSAYAQWMDSRENLVVP